MPATSEPPQQRADGRLRVVFMNWRDTSNPEGGGSEVYVEKVAESFAAAGHEVTIFCAAHSEAPDHEVRRGVRFVRAGSKLGVYLEAARHYRRGKLGDPDVVVDVQNGIPFFSRLVRRGTPTIVLVHHVHREQWPVVYGPLRSRIGWALESRVAPRVYRGSAYVTVSESSRDELVALGVRAQDISIVRNGTDTPSSPTGESRDLSPRVVVLGRIVPHKRVEIAIDTVADLRADIPGLTLAVIGDGWWSDALAQHIATRGAGAYVDLAGFVDDEAKHQALAASWVMLLPSLKEGWGLAVMEAAAHGVPCVAFRAAGGVQESILDGVTGLLVDTPEEMTNALRSLLVDTELRERLGAAARDRAALFTWEMTAQEFRGVVELVLAAG